MKITPANLLFGIRRGTIYRLVNKGQPDIEKFGKRIVLRRCDIKAFFAIPEQDIAGKLSD